MTLQETETTAVIEKSDETSQDSMESWASEDPLKLVAQALEDMGRTARPKDIERVLKSCMIRGRSWRTWWERVRPAVEKSPRYFTIGRRKEITFRGTVKVDDVSGEPWDALPGPVKKDRVKPPSPEDWTAWLTGKTDGQPPGRFPTKAVCNSFAKMSDNDIQTVMDRVMQGASEVLKSSKPGVRAAAGWAEAVSRAFLKCSEVSEVAPPDDRARRVGAILTRLAFVGRPGNRSAELLVSLGSLAPTQPEPEVWRRDLLQGMWQALRESRHGAMDLYRVASAPLEPNGRAALTQELAIGALSPTGPTSPRSDLDQMLDDLLPTKRARLFESLIVNAANGEAPGQAVLDYVADSHHSTRLPDPATRLNLLVMASLLLSEGTGQAVDEASEKIGAALTDAPDDGTSSVWSSLLSTAQQHIREVQARHARELEDQRLSYEARLEEMRLEMERRNREVDGLRSQIVQGREESRMDIRQDMLLVIAETLQFLPEWAANPEALGSNVGARLTLALGAGGAEEFGTVGETVPYDPTRHSALTSIPAASPVRICSPGFLVRGNLSGDRVLIKARVNQPSEVH